MFKRHFQEYDKFLVQVLKNHPCYNLLTSIVNEEQTYMYKRKFTKLIKKLIQLKLDTSVFKNMYFTDDKYAKELDKTFIKWGKKPEINRVVLPEYL